MRRTAAAMLGIGWHAAPRTLVWAFLATTLAAVASSAFPIGFHYLVDGALAHDGTEVLLGAVLAAALFALSWTLTMMAVARNSVLTDRVNQFLTERIATLVNAAPRLEHFERQDQLAEIDQLRQNRRTLAAAPRQLLRGWQTLLRAGTIMVLLATVYPPVMVVPLFGLLPGLADRRAARVQRRAGDELATDRRLAGDLFTLATTADTAKELRTYGITDALAERHAELTERIRRRSVRAALVSAVWEAAGWLGYALAFVGVIVVLVLRAAHGHATPGEVVMAVSLMRRAQVQVGNASDTAGSLATAVRTARRLAWLEDHVAAELTHPTPVPVPARLTGGITLEHVGFRYPAAERGETLHDVNLHLPAGGTVAIVGDNGAGKTTLVKLLTGMYRPTEGRVLVDGADLAAMPPADWRAATTAAFQDFLRPNLTAGEAVGIGDLARIDDEAAIRAALRRAGRVRLPDGLATQLGRYFSGGHDLSGGQWQRIALGRALMRRRPLLTVLDEPTASLDAAAEAELFTRFAELAGAGRDHGGVTVLVSHRFSTVRMADLIVVVRDGRVTESGGHDELLRAGGYYAQLFALQARAYTDRPN